MNKLMVASTILLLSGCQSLSNENLETAIIGNWQIESVMGAPVIDSSANLNFAEGGKVAGNNSCNNIFGQYSVEGDKVKLMPKGSTMMMCPDPIMRQADLIDKTLPLVVTAEINEGNLNLFDGDGNSLFILNKILKSSLVI